MLDLDNTNFYCLPPNAPNIANNAKNKATGNMPMTVHAVSLAFSHSVEPCPVGQTIASLTSEKMRIPIRRATAAPIKARMNPSDRTMQNCISWTYIKEKFYRLSDNVTKYLLYNP